MSVAISGQPQVTCRPGLLDYPSVAVRSFVTDGEEGVSPPSAAGVTEGGTGLSGRAGSDPAAYYCICRRSIDTGEALRVDESVVANGVNTGMSPRVCFPGMWWVCSGVEPIGYVDVAERVAYCGVSARKFVRTVRGVSDIVSPVCRTI